MDRLPSSRVRAESLGSPTIPPVLVMEDQIYDDAMHYIRMTDELRYQIRKN